MLNKQRHFYEFVQKSGREFLSKKASPEEKYWHSGIKLNHNSLIIHKGKRNTKKASDILKHQPRGLQYLTHAHSHITLAVAAMDSCFVLVRTHQHGIAPGQVSLTITEITTPKEVWNCDLNYHKTV